MLHSVLVHCTPNLLLGSLLQKSRWYILFLTKILPKLNIKPFVIQHNLIVVTSVFSTNSLLPFSC